MSTGGVGEDGARADGWRPRAGPAIGGSDGTGTSPSTWGQRPQPETGSAHVVAPWVPAGPAELTAGRRRLAAALHDGAHPPVTGEGAVERLLLAYEELASNAVRHGRGPVEVTVTSNDTCWLLEVSDAAADRPPSPAVGRDPARGGLGLHLVARLCDAHGWTTDGHRKTVWACIDHLSP